MRDANAGLSERARKTKVQALRRYLKNPGTKSVRVATAAASDLVGSSVTHARPFHSVVVCHVAT